MIALYLTLNTRRYVQTAQLVVTLVVMGHYPLNHHPARDGMHDVLNLLGFEHHPRCVMQEEASALLVSVYLLDLSGFKHHPRCSLVAGVWWRKR